MTCKIDALRARIKQRQMAVSSGDERLKVGISDQADWSKELHRLTTQWYRIHKSTVATRRVLVNEVVSLFDVKQGRIEDDEGEQTAMYHSICNLKLPSRPVDLTRCAKEPINAAVELIVHALLLFVRYLGIKLPFRLFYQQAHLYVRPSTIWKYAKEKMPLFLDDDRDYRKFILGVAMLNYNLAYLCHLQGVVVSMEQLADTLSLLSLCCRAPRLGIKSHATLHRGVRDLDCPLDFQQVVKITASRYWCGSPKKDALNAHVASIYDHFFSKRRRSNHTPTFDLTASRVGDTSDDDDEYENGEDDDDDEHWNLVDNVPIPSISTSPISTYRLFPSFQ
ncbi:UV radiation resistance protein and autophagy-related subunit 14-domain-containing protein [Radiomyces spectabilis]|uniref:UV radiation resistance protein and autophagy-related subunit 14-domain-containing protein n=1 Tax=Radiomyces spectabilis TaxID=64574 RepID=UPI00221E4BD3|nr:UV radiation resistance protein and autophagy-related subunit 14-domain-containing protein [Radiomyces spectabilis]KAI8373151.1 UV radiation resistance protein and autophagy-related subunit 14-domain-containing protein [Radiomyces spectabilis]